MTPPRSHSPEAENELFSLRQRVAELEQQNMALLAEASSLRRQVEWLQSPVNLQQHEVGAGSASKNGRKPGETMLSSFQAVIEHAPDCIAITDGCGRVTYTNPAFETMSDFGSRLVIRFIRDTLAEGIAQEIQTGVKWQGMLNFRRRDGTTFTGLLSAFVIPHASNTSYAAAGIVRDVTEQVRAEKEQAALQVALQEQLIQSQQDTIRELSTPVIPVADRVVVMPLVGTIDSSRARHIFQTLLEGITAQHAEIAILDTTGIRVVDSQVASALIGTARAARLLGSKVILTGISPAIAQSLVQLGVDLAGIEIYGTLQRGVAAALQQQ